MTDVSLACNKEGVFRSCKACGHSSFAKKGNDIVCAAESIILRTVVEMLEQTKEIVVDVDSSTRGFLEFRVERYTESSLERLKCIGDFIRLSFTSLSIEYPKNVHFEEKLIED